MSSVVFPVPLMLQAGPLAADRALLLIAYAIVIALGSLAGGGLLKIIRLTHTRMQVMMSGVGGLMLGIALFQLLPHAVEETGDLNIAIYALTAGLLFMFLLIRAFHFHAHDVAVEEPHEHPHGHGCSHGHDHDAGPTAHELSWVGVAFGLAIHTLIDGVALGAAIESAHSSAGWLAGLGTFLAIALHKPLDALSISSVMAAAGRPPGMRTAVNVGFSLMCPLGAAVFLLGVRQLSETQHLVTGIALGFSAGAFLCIALGDLLPELEFHSHDRVKLSAALIAGLLLALLIEKYGHPAVHEHPRDAATNAEP
ncbi:MAG: ZIP family metal transporter [Planctomycetaceae bacterium]